MSNSRFVFAIPIIVGAGVWAATRPSASVAAEGCSNHGKCLDGVVSAPVHNDHGDPIWATIPPNEPGGAYAAVCFAPGTTPAAMQRGIELVAKRMGRSLGKRQDFFLGGTPWGGGGGNPATLRWSFVPDGLAADGQPSTLFSSMDSKFATAGGRAKWITLFNEIFSRWSSVSGLRYARVQVNGDADDGAAWGEVGGNSTRGDVRISMTPIDGQWNVLAYNYYPAGSNGIGGDMVIDNAEDWGGTSVADLKANDWRFLRNTLGHEHGHGMGIAHVCPIQENKLMEPFLTLAFDGPQHDDIRAAQTLYGDAVEPNNTSGAATDLGILAVPGTVNNFADLPAPFTGVNPTDTSRLSIERTAAEDWFKFTVNGPTRFTFTLNPVGKTYLNGSQNQNGSCSAGTNFDSLSVANLRFNIVGADGTTVLQSVDANPAGQSETGTVDFNAAGTYFVQVSSNGTHTQAQMYSFVTQTQSLTQVSGNVTLQGVVPSGVVGKQVVINLLTPGTNTVQQTATVSLGANGLYSFVPTVAPGNYDVTFKGATFLRKRVNGIAVSTGVTAVNATLTNGDANGDNIVTTTDFAIVNKAFGATPASANWDARADLNGDGTVNATDTALVRASLRLKGD